MVELTSRSDTEHEVIITFGREQNGLNGTNVNTVTVDFEYGYPTWPNTLRSIFNGDQISSTIDAGFARGTGLTGFSLDLSFDPNGIVNADGWALAPSTTEVFAGTVSVDLSGSVMGVGAATEIDIFYTRDYYSGDLDFEVEVQSIFAGLSVIAGDYSEVEGLGFGAAIEGRSGLLVDSTGIYYVNDLDAVVGFGFLGHASLPNIEGLVLLAGPGGREKSLLPDNQCFLPGTSITFSDGSMSAIEDVSVGDIVQSYNYEGNLVPGRVVRTFSKEVSHVLDFFGTGMTPGHVTLCGEGQFAGQHVPIMDILRSDGAIVKHDGTLIRAATGCVVGSEGDAFVTAIIGDRRKDGRFDVHSSSRIRLGTRVFDQNGTDVSVLELIELNGGKVTDEGLIETLTSNQPLPFVWLYGPGLPKPEDYVLQRSGFTLRDIYEANEWEKTGPRLSHPDAAHLTFSN